MSQETSIEWTHFPNFAGATWNPVTGCTKIAQGRKHCYAETIAKRFWKDRKFTDVQTHPERLDAPLRRRKPTCYFVNSMSDLFHDDVPFEFIAAVYGVMAACPRHLFITLTKRPKRMREFMAWVVTRPAAHRPFLPPRVVCADAPIAYNYGIGQPHTEVAVSGDWPLPNVIHGYSAANQADLDAGVGDLLATPSALRCLSLEPLIGPVDASRYMATKGWDVLRCGSCGYTARGDYFIEDRGLEDAEVYCPVCNADSGSIDDSPSIDWILVGGESGPGARPCDIEWIRRIVAQCKAAGARCFVKQVGAQPFERHLGGTDVPLTRQPLPLNLRNRKGADPAEWPQEINVRQYPEVARG